MPKQHRIAVLAVYLLFASIVFAQVTVTSVTPNVGSPAGGTEVIIRGTGFTEIIGSPMQPPGVIFDRTPAMQVQLIDETTIRAITPPHLPGVVRVLVGSQNGTGELANAFTYFDATGDDHFERFLLPFLIPPAPGAFGSEWHTEFQVSSRRTLNAHAEIYGVQQVCPAPPVGCPERNLSGPLFLPSSTVGPIRVDMVGTPGRFIYVPRSQVERISMNLRIRDVSRDDENFGTEIPILGENEFKSGKIILLGVPLDARFRNTLRIYGEVNWPMRITIGNRPPVDILMTPGRDQYEPAYAVFTDFPAGTGTIDVTIEPAPNDLPVVPPPFWAFIAVTNNTTQMVTTITPEP